MKKDKTAYVTLNHRDKHPVSFLQVRKFLRQMDIIYDEDEEAAKIEYIMQFLPVIFELIQLKCNILEYHKKTKILLASRLLHLEKISQIFVTKGNNRIEIVVHFVFLVYFRINGCSDNGGGDFAILRQNTKQTKGSHKKQRR
jgi:hypothetical protein